MLLRGVYYEPDEILVNKVDRIIQHLLPNITIPVQVVGAERLSNRNPKYPALVKIAFATVDQKIAVLKAKRHLTTALEFKSVRLWSSKTHVERLLELNFKTMMDCFPDFSKNYRITTHGKVVKKGSFQYQMPATSDYQTAPTSNQLSGPQEASYQVDDRIPTVANWTQGQRNIDEQYTRNKADSSVTTMPKMVPQPTMTDRRPAVTQNINQVRMPQGSMTQTNQLVIPAAGLPGPRYQPPFIMDPTQFPPLQHPVNAATNRGLL